MIEKYRPLYCDMLKDLARCQKMELPNAEWVTSCFWVAHNYWGRLKELTDPNRFIDEKEEIEFFRDVKPSFTSQIEYFVLLSEALTCVPCSRSNAFTYWEVEAKRYCRFCERNSEFISYYESGQSCKDNLYFLRRNAGLSYIPKAAVYDVDPEYCTSHDHLVRSYLAQKKYYEFVQEKLIALNKIKSI